MRKTLNYLKNNECEGEDRIIAEILKIGRRKIEQIFKILSNEIIESGNIQHNSEVILMFKKGDNTITENFLPIYLLSQL